MKDVKFSTHSTHGPCAGLWNIGLFRSLTQDIRGQWHRLSVAGEEKRLYMHMHSQDDVPAEERRDAA